MKQMHTPRLAWLIGLLLLLSAGCNKKIDKLPDGSSLCSVQVITSPSLNPTEIGPTDTIRFSYDSYGNPVTIGRLETGTELNDFVFWYDHEHRLTDVIGTFGLPAPTGTVFDTWHKLYYTNGRITLDTTFDFGLINGTRPIPLTPQDNYRLIRRISTFEYDAQGRISRAKDTLPDGFVQINIYTYDRNGNLARLTTVTPQAQSTSPPDTTFRLASGYDNKVNINRTNPIWQFLDRDYSMNNQFTADKYNELGLPTVISNENIPFTFLNISAPITIRYSCQLTGKGDGHGY